MTETDQHDDIYRDFRDAVNMAPTALERFLETNDSKRVGWKGEDGDGGGESVGHKSGRRIVAIKHKHKADLTDDDYAHMKKVVGYVRRHLAQGGPKQDVAHSDWRYSLMNWGHDPLKD
ncbi:MULTISPECIES: DUF3140 domain-containing protein [unclassified Sphingomonas]|uniref:DUF3140 domain-containing protein n=1 Tax=unclassified Sphingomonas TaxID=196159 RepID=UPI001E406A2F|nr:MULTISPECIES: DUF3140 domain-containing protein [unclassified Sphingomonas]